MRELKVLRCEIHVFASTLLCCQKPNLLYFRPIKTDVAEAGLPFAFGTLERGQNTVVLVV